MSSFQPQADFTRLPRRMSAGDEFLHLMEQRKRIDQRLDQLVELLDDGRAPGTLPKSKLKLVATSNRPGSMLFKGGRNDD